MSSIDDINGTVSQLSAPSVPPRWTALWVFDLPSQNADDNITADNERSSQLREVAAANARARKSGVARQAIFYDDRWRPRVVPPPVKSHEKLFFSFTLCSGASLPCPKVAKH